MGNLFGTVTTPEQMLEDNQKLLRAGVRELDREAAKMQRSDLKLIAEIKQMAERGQSASVKIMAKELIRSRNATMKFYAMSAQLKAVSIRIRTMQSTATMSNAMRGATRAMIVLNRQMNNQDLQRIMIMFEREGDAMDMKQEIMDDTIDNVVAGEMDEEQEEELIGQIMDEIGIEMTATLNNVPSHKNTTGTTANNKLNV